jgi:lipopolysaccharide export LptBFGC system permease protein LptF
MLPPLLSPSPVEPLLVLYLVPQALPLAIPFGLFVGILSAFGGRAVSRRAAGRVLLLGAVCSALMFVTIGWLVPSANYAYRVRVAERVGEPVAFEKPIEGAPLWKGPNELTLPEFRRMYLRVTTTDEATGLPRAGWYDLHNLWYMYHVRWALPCVSLVFALVALSVTRHRPVVRITALLAATTVYFYMFALAGPGPTWLSNAAQGYPPAVLAWLPNILLAGAALAWMAAGRMRLQPSGQ